MYWWVISARNTPCSLSNDPNLHHNVAPPKMDLVSPAIVVSNFQPNFDQYSRLLGQTLFQVLTLLSLWVLSQTVRGKLPIKTLWCKLLDLNASLLSPNAFPLHPGLLCLYSHLHLQQRLFKFGRKSMTTRSNLVFFFAVWICSERVNSYSEKKIAQQQLI